MKKRILSLLLACLMLLSAIPALALAATAEEADVLTSTWDQSDPANLHTAMREDIREGYVRMFVWYDADGNLLPVDGYAEGSTEKNEYTCMDDGCYAILNPELYTIGVFREGMTNDEIWEAYGAYLLECSSITYPSDWSVGNMVDGEFVTVASRCFIYNAKGLYNVRKNRSAGAIFPTDGVESNGQFCTTWENAKRYYDEFVALGKEDSKIREDGKVYWSDIAEDDFYLRQISDYEWNAGAGGFSAVVSNADASMLAFVLRPDTYGPVSLRYTVPENIYGTATLDFGSLFEFYVSGGALEAQGAVCIAVNGEAVWPVGATVDDKSTWAKVNETSNVVQINGQLAAVPMDVRAGDTIDILLARDGSGKVSLDIKPTVSIEKKYLVAYKDQNDKLIFDTLVVPGGDMPAAPVASKNGFFINGATEAVSELPATVNGNMTVKYVGDFDIAEVTVEKSNVAISTDFKVTLYLKADPSAVTVGYATDEGEEVIGVLGEDGLYKVTIPGIAAKDLDTDINLYLFQEFAGGVDATNEEAYVLNPLNLLKTYTTDEAYADVKPLAEAAIDYAAAAKAYFNGEELDAETEARLAGFDDEIAALSKEINVSGSGVYNIARATLVLTNKVAIKIGVETEDCVTLEDSDLAMTVRVGDEEYTGFTIQQGSEYVAMVITLGGVGAADFDEVQEITIIDGMKRKSGTLSYSVNTYIARTFEGGAGVTDNLLRALYALGAAANA